MFTRTPFHLFNSLILVLNYLTNSSTTTSLGINIRLSKWFCNPSKSNWMTEQDQVNIDDKAIFSHSVPVKDPSSLSYMRTKINLDRGWVPFCKNSESKILQMLYFFILFIYLFFFFVRWSIGMDTEEDSKQWSFEFNEKW